MNFSLGGLKRGMLAITVISLLSISLAACSSDTKLDAKKQAVTATPDQKAIDTAEIEDVYARFWAAMAEAENNADASPERFSNIIEGSYGERYLKLVRDYKSQDIKRVGRAVISRVDVNLNGDTAAVLACVNEDNWVFEQGGDAMKQPKLGAKPTGALVKRTNDGWVITDVPDSPDKSKKC